MVLEVEARDVLARTGTWSPPAGPTVRLPLLLEAASPSLEADTGWAEAVLVAAGHRGDAPGPRDGGALLVADGGSALRPMPGGPAGAHVTIPPEHPLPPSLADELTATPLATVSDDGVVEVVHGASSRLSDLPPPPREVELLVLASSAALASRPSALVDAVAAARSRAGPGRLLYLPGVATPRTLALLTYTGADVVDDVQCLLEAARGRRLRPELGHLHAAPGMGEGELARENRDLLRQEVQLVRQAIDHGTLRELVEVRVRSEPWQVAALRRLDRAHGDLLLPFCPVHRDAPLLALTRESLGRIEVASWCDRLEGRYAPPPSARVLVLLPCSARKPYSTSRTHRRFEEALSGVGNRGAVHEVVLTSPMGAVPRELERTYPAAFYDIPVSGDWFPDEVDRMCRLLGHIRQAGAYDAVVSHMGPGLRFLDEDPGVVASRREGEGSLDPEGLSRLAELVSEAAALAPRVGTGRRLLEDVAALARFQFGPEAAAALLEGCRVDGRPPALKLRGPEGTQRGMVVPARGLLSLTLEGAELVAGAGGHRVWMDDFELRGDLFAVGVLDVDPQLRPAEEAVVTRGEEVVAVGVARMGAPEMLAASRGVAVAVRHKRKGGGGG